MKVKKNQLWKSKDPREKQRGLLIVEKVGWTIYRGSYERRAQVLNVSTGKRSSIECYRMEDGRFYERVRGAR